MSGLTAAAVKRLLIGAPRASAELERQRLPRWMALPVFASDALSSVAYATEEMMVVLALAGAAAFSRVTPLSWAVVVLLTVVVAGYRQTVQAYPDGGGAYLVARRNLGTRPGLVAAAALLIDYTLTVAVSIAAGTAAVVSALPALQGARVSIAVGFVLLMTVANLRGVREAGLVVAAPAYAFVVTMLVLIATGVVRCVGGCPAVPFVQQPVPSAVTSLSLFLVLRAFATGATALTGVEAISNGVQAFRRPRSRNAASTLTAMGVLAVTMFMGISYLAARVPGVVAFDGSERTVTSQIAAAVFGGTGPGFYAVQVATAAILVLAANTAYADFPRLASLLARDHFLPRQLQARGDRLVYSNGILALAAVAVLLLVASGARVTGLVGLYVVGVFTSFTLSQTGMVRHWLRERGQGWRRRAGFNALGAVVTATVLLIVAVTKFRLGAWVILLAIPLLVAGMEGVARHYRTFTRAISSGALARIDRQPIRPVHVVILEDRVDAATAAAVSYARGIGPASLQAVIVPRQRGQVSARWRQLAPDVPFREIGGMFGGRAATSMRDAARAVAAEHGSEGFTVAMVPEIRSENWVDVLRWHLGAQRAKARLVADGTLVVANVVSAPGGPGPYQVAEPIEHHVVVLVNRVHLATMRALAYAQSIEATTVRALSINVSAQRSGRILTDWQEAGIGVPLELVDSPFRSITETVRDYVRALRPDGQHTVVTVVMPEFVLPRWWQRSLHNQTVLLIKSALLFERGTIATSVPWLIPRLTGREEP